MQTDDLIQSLATRTRPVPRHAVERRVLIGLGAGAILTLMLMVEMLGIRPDLMPAMHDFAFWMKWTYTAWIAVVAVIAVAQVARPDTLRGAERWLLPALLLPVVVVAILAAREMAMNPMPHWMPMWMGHSWKRCPANVLILSLPVFGGLLWAFRTLAPTQLRAAGAAAGLAAGATGATIYGLHCQEVTAMFLLTWYSLGIAAVTLLGALVGPRLMRW